MSPQGSRRTRRDGQGPHAALVLLAAGSGSRVGAPTNKVLLPLAGRRVLTWSLTWTSDIPSIAETVVVALQEDLDEIEAALDREAPGRPVGLVVGGATRHASEYAALTHLAPLIDGGEIDVVVIHDAARPLTGRRMFADVVDAAHLLGGALPLVRQPGLLSVNGGSPPLESLMCVQTPQAFRAAPLLAAYRAAADAGFDGTDTAVCVQQYQEVPIRAMPGSVTNIKITFPEDLFLAERILADHRWTMP